MRVLCAGLYLVLLSQPSFSGVYSVMNCGNPILENWCAAALTQAAGETVNPTGRVHPVGFDGSGGALIINVCTTGIFPGEMRPIEARVQDAIATWNALVPSQGNCPGECRLVEDLDPSPDTDPYDFESVVLHELGHCAYGLDHPNLQVDLPNDVGNERVNTSYTAGYNGSTALISAGTDTIRGTADDEYGNICDVHWFRISDNDPVVIDATPIDSMTYSRSVLSNLGMDFPVNANREAALSLGAPLTNAVMYSNIARNQVRDALTADEVNMVKNLLIGSDRIAGNADDYTVTLQYVADCSTADIQVGLVEFGDPPNGRRLGGCTAEVDFAFTQNPILADDYVVIKPTDSDRLTILLNDDWNWSFGSQPPEVFSDGFETGDTSAWVP